MKPTLAIPFVLACLAGCGESPPAVDYRAEYLASCEKNMPRTTIGADKIGSFCTCLFDNASKRYSAQELYEGLRGPGPKPKDLADEIRACQAENS